MITRERAIEALTSERFDIVVIGGGITGAGVALDAASRGYSVALVEKADFASGTSSRSSKLVHGGLRYLQNFDLGLVREALLERQLMVRLAPHLVRPLQLVVPAFDGARPDRLIGIGLNMYDVMATPRLRGRRANRRGRGRSRRGGRQRLEPGSPPGDLRRGGDRAAARAGRPGAQRRLSVLRLPDRRCAAGPDRARRGRALRRDLRQPHGGDRAGPRGRARGRRHGPRRGGGRSVHVRRRQRDQRHRRVGRPDPPRGAALRGRVAPDHAQPRHPRHDGPRGPAPGGRSDRAGRRRSLDLCAAVARAAA